MCNDILNLVRYSPYNAFTNYGFIGTSELGYDSPGGLCEVKIRKIDDAVYQLYASPGSKDYFYGFKKNGLASCQVNLGAPAGTIVLTVGMNGCGLSVYKQADCIKFFHVSDEHFEYLDDIPGIEIYRLSYRDRRNLSGSYDFFNRGQSLVDPDGQSYSLGSYFEHTNVCIKLKENKWGVFHSAILSQSTSSRPPTRQYSRFISTVSEWLASFEE